MTSRPISLLAGRCSPRSLEDATLQQREGSAAGYRVRRTLSFRRHRGVILNLGDNQRAALRVFFNRALTRLVLVRVSSAVDNLKCGAVGIKIF